MICNSLAFPMDKISPPQNFYGSNKVQVLTTTINKPAMRRHPSSGELGKQTHYTFNQSQQCTVRTSDRILHWTPETADRKETSDDKFTPPDQIGMQNVNPFDIGIADRLHLPACSPSVFSIIATPDKKEEPFWSIEQIAVLHPVDIEETPNQGHAEIGNDAETEKRAQDAINRFFSQHEIVPSPWLPANSMQTRSRSFSPAATSTACMKKTITRKGCFSKQDAWTQTALTLPFDLDVEKLLAQYYTFPPQQCKLSGYTSQMSEGDESKDSLLSTSTLRRKLFVHESFCSSPDKQNSPVSDQNSPPVSPLKETPGKDKHSLLSSSNSAQFSSSPIVSPMGRSSISPLNKMSPPCLSPISRSILKTPISSSSSGASSSINSRHVTISKLISYDESLQAMSVNNTFSSVSIDRHHSNGGAEASCMKLSIGDEEVNSHSDLQNGINIKFSASDSPENQWQETNEDLNHYNSMSEMESFPAVISQDTGYQTGSLQSTTNPDYTHMSIFMHNGPSATTSLTSCNLQFVGRMTPPNAKHCVERNILKETKVEHQIEKAEVDISYKVTSSSGYCSMTFSKRDVDVNPSCVSSWEPMHSSTPTKGPNDICGMSIDDTR